MVAVPATSLPFVKSQFFDNNGNKLNGGLLFTYAAGTTTKQATYTDATTGTQNANPVVLDANGRADVFLDPTISPYKFVLSPSTDTDPPTNAIWTEDNIWPAFNGGAPFTLTAAAVNETSLTLASAATVNIGGAKANYIFISGAVTITAFDTVQSGVERTLEFQGALILTHNGTSLILPGAANITTAAGDTAKFRSEGSGNWRCVTYQKTTNWTNAVVDATNGGIGVTITGGSAALKINPSDLATKSTPTTSDSVVIMDAAASNAAKTALLSAVTPFSKSFTSAAQTITSGGALTLAHGLGAKPSLMQARLINTTGELGYSQNDEVVVDTLGGPAVNRGFSLVPDATNLNVRFGSDAAVFDLLNKGTGASATITNGNWQIVFRAWL